MNLFKTIFAVPLLSVLFLAPAVSGQGQDNIIRNGDILEVRVFGHDALSRNIMVQPDGTVNYPLIADVPIAGLMLDEFRELLSAQAMKYLGERPIITVAFSQSLAVRVTVLGMVQAPGEYLVAKSATLQGAITEARGFTPRAELDSVRLVRKAAGRTETQFINLRAFYTSGDHEFLPELEEGDVIFVPGLPGSNDIKVMGEVRSPGSYLAYIGANVLDLLYMAGGPTKNADLRKVQLISPRRTEGREKVIDLSDIAMLSEAGLFPEVVPGDVLYIPEKKQFWRQLLTLTRDITGIVMPIAMILFYINR